MERLIDADEYEKRIKPYDTEDVMDKALYNFAHYHLVTTPTAQSQDIARDIATIIENEKDMRVVLKNAEPQWIPVTKEEMFKAGYEGREIRFRVDGRLFAIRELAQ